MQNLQSKTKDNFIFRFGFMILISFFLLTFYSKNAFSAEKQKDILIGVSLPTQRDTGWVRYKKAFDGLSKSMPNVRVLIQTADQDANQQAAQVENLLAKKIDVLILAPQDAFAAASLVEAAHKANVKVISLDRLIVNSPVDLYASFDNEKVGELQGEYLVSHVPKGNYILLSGAPTDNNSKLFLKGALKFIEPLQKSGNINVVMNQPIDDWQPNAAQKLVENALTKNKNNVQAILAPNDNTAGGVVEALETQKLTAKVIVTGQDAETAALQRIVKGTQSMTVFKNQTELASAVYQAAILMSQDKLPATTTVITNGKYQVPSYFLSPIVITQSNLDKELIESGYFTRAAIYAGK